MRPALRFLAAVKPGRYLEPGAPTGLTGLFTHPSPRTRLLILYSSILEQLKALPESSVYRQSTEALTKHRLNIIEQIKPPGHEEWQKRTEELIVKHPEVLTSNNPSFESGIIGDSLVISIPDKRGDEELEWDGEEVATTWEGPKTERAGRLNAAEVAKEIPDPEDAVDWEPEPALEASQISEAETQIGAGLIEEVIQVAEGELELIDTMTKNKVWEELEEKPPAGQWEYFSRDQHTPETQAPPTK